jgi:hypothetical protein
MQHLAHEWMHAVALFTPGLSATHGVRGPDEVSLLYKALSEQLISQLTGQPF